MSNGLGLGLIALLLAMWAIHWARRAANAAERAAIAAEKTALDAGRIAMAAKRAAEAAEAAAREPGKHDQGRAAGNGASANIDALIRYSVSNWDEERSTWPLISRHPALTDAEVEMIVHRVFYSLGRTDDEATQHAQAVLNLRRGTPL